MKGKNIVLIIVLVQFVHAMDFVMVMPLGPDLALALNFKPEFIAWITSIYTIAAALITVLSAAFLDKFDRKRILVIALVGMIFSTVLGGFATNLNSMLVSRFLAGGFGGISIAMGMAIVADVVPEKDRGKALSLIMIGFPLSAIVGVPASLYIAQTLSWQWSFYLLSLIIGIVALMALVTMPSIVSHKINTKNNLDIKSIFTNPGMAVGVFATALCVFPAFLFVPHISAIVQYNYGFPRDQLSLLYLTTGLINLPMVIVIGILVDRISASVISTCLAVIFAINLYLWFLVEKTLPIFIYHIVFFVCFTAYFIPTTAIASKLPKPYERAGFSALQSFFQHIFISLSSLLSFYLIGSESDGAINNLDLLAVISISTVIFIPVSVFFIQRQLSSRNISNSIPEKASTTLTEN